MNSLLSVSRLFSRLRLVVSRIQLLWSVGGVQSTRVGTEGLNGMGRPEAW